MAGLRVWLNRALDRVVRPQLTWCGRNLSSFKVFGYIGLALAVLLSTTLIASRGLPLWVLPVLVLCAVLTFYTLAMATKLLTGEERLVYYHQEIAIVTVAAGVLALLDQPVFEYLDAVILGIGIFLVCGRIGCFMVGCCHGRPGDWGVCYRSEHARTGFASYLVGVRLLPVQLVESLWVFCIVALGSVLVLAGELAGAALTLYIVAYDLGRFCLEFMRGDTGRPYFKGFSEAQWISVALVLAVVLAEGVGILAVYGWHVAVAVGMVVGMLALALSRIAQGSGEHLLFQPRHIREVIRAIELLSSEPYRALGGTGMVSSPQDIPIMTSSLGLRLSAASLQDTYGPVRCYSISRPERTLGRDAAFSLLRQIGRIKHEGTGAEIIPGRNDVYHLCVHMRAASEEKSRT